MWKRLKPCEAPEPDQGCTPCRSNYLKRSPIRLIRCQIRRPSPRSHRATCRCRSQMSNRAEEPKDAPRPGCSPTQAGTFAGTSCRHRVKLGSHREDGLAAPPSLGPNDTIQLGGQGLLYVGKEETTIKRDHARQPHGLVRIRRRSIVVPETRRRGTPAWPGSPASLARPASAISYLCWPKTLPRPATKPSIRVQTLTSSPS